MPLQALRSKPYWAPLTWVIVAVTFAADIFLPPSFGIASMYLLAILIGVFFQEKNDVMLVAVVATALTMIAVPLMDRTAPIEQMLIDRISILVVLWAATYFVILFIAVRNEEEVQQEKFKALFKHATQGILLADHNGKIVLSNPSSEQLFGYPPGGMNGLKVEALIPRRYAERHVHHRESFQGNPHARAMGIGLSLSGLKADGTEFPVEVSLSPFHGQAGSFTVAFIVDNTIRKNYEDSILDQRQELANLTKALRELNENLEAKVAVRTAELEQAKNDLSSALEKERELGELKSRFVSMASHEFRTPLSAVLSSASLISSYVERQDLASIKKHTERIKNAVNGLNTILTEFLSLGKLEEGHIRPKLEAVNLPHAVSDVASEMKSLFKSGQEFFHRHQGPDTITLDPGLLKNVLINLISNAIKYSPDSGRIFVDTDVDAERARISVRDEGIGIPESEQKHLFDRFFRATNAINIHGTGLGLYIVRRYVEMMEGKIGFVSGEGTGTEFWVEFPVAPLTLPQGAGAGASSDG